MTSDTKPAFRVLLAEDVKLNQILTQKLLARSGYQIDIAENGLRAVEALQNADYDVILMDVQMPEMDGIEATRRIREMEAATGAHVQIVAMTAHAMAGDRERCLAEGMDDYIAKPLSRVDVLRVLENCGSPLASRAPEPPAEPARDGMGPPMSLYTREEMLEQCEGDDKLMARLIVLFLNNTPRLINDIRGSIARHDGAGLAFGAHALLSNLGVFGAGDACHLTRQLEAQAFHKDYEKTDLTFAALERGMAEIHGALAAYASPRA